MSRTLSAFSNHEAVILLNRYLVLSQRGLSRKQIAVRVSKELRQMAINSGRNIDKFYRSIAGISGQLVSMESAFTGTQKKRVAVPYLFTQIVDLYNNNRQQYDELLHDAENMIVGTEQSSEAYSESVPEHELRHDDSKALRVKLTNGHNREGDPGVLKKFTLSAFPELAYTKPCSFRFANDELVEVQNWADVFRGVLRKLSSEQMQELMRQFDNKTIAPDGAEMRSPEKIAPGIFVEMNLSTDSIIQRLKSFLDSCGLSTEIIVISYRDSRNDVMKTMTLQAFPELSYAKPVAFQYGQTDCMEVSKWSELFYNVLLRMSTDQFQMLMECFDKSIISPNGLGMRRPVEICPNVFVEMNLSSIELIRRLKRFFECCKIDPDELTIAYRNNTNMDDINILNGKTVVPDGLREYIINNYSMGMRFDDTVLRLIGDRLGIQIDEDIWKVLRGEMFKRGDDLYFFDAMIADPNECMRIKAQTQSDLEAFGLCEIDVLYERFLAKSENTCIRDADDFADFLMHLLPNSIRIATIAKTKVIYRRDTSKKDSINTLTRHLIETISEKGSVTQDDLIADYSVMSEQLLGRLLDKRSDEVIKTTINGIVCYQSVNGLGLDESFSETLNSVLERIEELDLQPNCEVIHTFLSIEYGLCFRDAYLIQDDQTLRRIIARYYTGKIPRTWKAGCFTEE